MRSNRHEYFFLLILCLCSLVLIVVHILQFFLTLGSLLPKMQVLKGLKKKCTNKTYGQNNMEDSKHYVYKTTYEYPK